jgi:hypothetical protein
VANEETGRRLDHLHAIIQRLASNSFTIKGWAIAVVSAFLGFGIKDAKPAVAFVGLVPVVIFWLIDASYLASERYFRHCYNEILETPRLAAAPIVGHAVDRKDLLNAAKTPVVAGLYLTLAACCMIFGIGLFTLHAQ